MGRALEGNGEQTAPHSRHGRPPGAVTVLLSSHILEVATDHFIAHGYAGTRMEAVAAAAQIAKRTLYQRYRDKRDLLKAVCQKVCGEYLQTAQLAVCEGSVRHRLVSAALAILDLTLSPRTTAFERLRQEVLKVAPDLIDDLQQRVAAAWTAVLEDILASTSNEFDDEKRAFLASVLLDMLVTVPRRRILELGTLENNRDAKLAVINRTLDVLIAGMPFLSESEAGASARRLLPQIPLSAQLRSNM